MTESLSWPRYSLAPHVHACGTDSHVVLLDLKRDRYLGISGPDALALRDQVLGLPATKGFSERATEPEPDPHTSGEKNEKGLLVELLEQQMLASCAGDDEAPSVASIDRPERALIEGYVETRTDIRWRDVVSFLIASLTAAGLLRWRSLEQIVTRIRCRRQVDARSEFDADRARQSLAVFNRLRPFVYSASNACLFSSLATREYLARARLFPRLVFGVATNPFKAHCWLQEGDVVINDTPEHVREYTPILVV